MNEQAVAPPRLGSSLWLRDVVHRYRRKVALDELTFVASSLRVGVLGENGAGKTTLLRILAGRLAPSSGRYGLPDGSIGLCPQSVDLPRGPRVEEFLTYLLWLRGTPSGERAALVGAALAAADLEDERRTRLTELSGGMQRRVLLAQALMGSPRVLLLDEPTSGVDPVQRVRIRDVLREVDPSTLMVLSSHVVEDLAAVCDEVLVLRRGALFAHVPITDRSADAAHLETLLVAAAGEQGREQR